MCKAGELFNKPHCKFIKVVCDRDTDANPAFFFLLVEEKNLLVKPFSRTYTFCCAPVIGGLTSTTGSVSEGTDVSECRAEDPGSSTYFGKGLRQPVPQFSPFQMRTTSVPVLPRVYQD